MQLFMCQKVILSSKLNLLKIDNLIIKSRIVIPNHAKFFALAVTAIEQVWLHPLKLIG